MLWIITIWFRIKFASLNDCFSEMFFVRNKTINPPYKGVETLKCSWLFLRLYFDTWIQLVVRDAQAG